MRLPLAALIGLVLAFGVRAVAAETSHDAASKSPLAREREVQRQVSEGKIRYRECVTDSMVTNGDQPMIVFRNSCDAMVSVELCARSIGDVESNHFFFIVSGRSKSNFRFWFKTGRRFHYTYNTCGVDYCMPPDSDC